MGISRHDPQDTNDAKTFGRRTQAVQLAEGAPVDTVPAPSNEAAPAKVILAECGTCTKYWRPLHNVPGWGECTLTAKGRPSPELTTDRQSCSSWAVA